MNQPFGGSLFGTAAPATGGGGLFGNTATATTPAAGGLFGNTATAATTPAAGGLFGNTATATTPAAGGLFGNTAPTTSTAPATGGGLFGNTATTTPAAGGLFGNTATATTPAAGGLFGNTATATTPAAGGLFGSTATTTPAAGGLFGAGTMSGLASSASQPGLQPVDPKADKQNQKLSAFEKEVVDMKTSMIQNTLYDSNGMNVDLLENRVKTSKKSMDDLKAKQNEAERMKTEILDKQQNIRRKIDDVRKRFGQLQDEFTKAYAVVEASFGDRWYDYQELPSERQFASAVRDLEARVDLTDFSEGKKYEMEYAIDLIPKCSVIDLSASKSDIEKFLDAEEAKILSLEETIAKSELLAKELSKHN